MWAALFDFSLMILLMGFFLYGIGKWDGLLMDLEEPETEPSEIEMGEQASEPPGRKTAIWILIAGTGIISLLGDILSWWQAAD